MVLAAIVVVILAFVVIGIINTGAISSENRIYSEALTIKNDTALTVDQKIEKLSLMETKSGISSSVKLFLAALYFEKGDVPKAEEVLKNFSTSSDLLKSEKKLMDAEVLNATGKKKEALDLLNNMLADPKSQIGKDFILLRMARIQKKDGQVDTALTNLNKLVEEYPQSYHSYEARNLIKELEKK